MALASTAQASPGPGLNVYPILGLMCFSVAVRQVGGTSVFLRPIGPHLAPPSVILARGARNLAPGWEEMKTDIDLKKLFSKVMDEGLLEVFR